MSAAAMKAVATYLTEHGADLAPSRKGVLIELADPADRHGISWPSIETLCKRAGICERTTQRAIRELRERGVVLAIPCANGQGRNMTPFYWLVLPGLDGDLTAAVERRERKTGTVRVGGDSFTLSSVTPEGDTPTPALVTRIERRNQEREQRKRCSSSPDLYSPDPFPSSNGTRAGRGRQERKGSAPRTLAAVIADAIPAETQR